MRAARWSTGGLPRTRGVRCHGVFLSGCRTLRFWCREYLPVGRRQLQVRTRTCDRVGRKRARAGRRNGRKLLMKRHTAPIGWTMVELVVVIVILGSVAAIGTGLLSSIFRSYLATRDMTSSDGQARAAFERMTRELRQARSATATDLDVASTAQVRFIDTDGNGVCFYRDAANNRLMRSADGPATACGTTSAPPLSDFVAGLLFPYYLNDGRPTPAPPTPGYDGTGHLDVHGHNVSDTLRATIHPRNF